MAGLVWAVADLKFPDLAQTAVMGCIVAAYMGSGLVLMSVSSVFELLILIGISSAVLFGLLYAGDDYFRDGSKLVLWSLLCGSVCAPLLATSTALAFATEQKK